MTGTLAVTIASLAISGLPKRTTRFAHIFEPQRATACQHRKNDYWHHDPATKTWTRVHIQPRKHLYVPSKADAGFRILASLPKVRRLR